MAYIYKIAIVTMSALILAVSLSMFFSDLYSLKTKLFTDNWSKHSIQNSLEWKEANKAAEKALKIYPVENPLLYQNLAQTHHWKGALTNDITPQLRKEFELALDLYKKQVELAPLHPKGWLSIIEVKSLLNQFDKDFYYAVEKATYLINENPYFLSKLTTTLVYSWAGVNNKLKTTILNLVIKEISKNIHSSEKLKPHLINANILKTTCIYAKAIKSKTYYICK